MRKMLGILMTLVMMMTTTALAVANLDDGAALDIALNDIGVSVTLLSEIKISMKANDTAAISFVYDGEVCSYLIDLVNGEILEKDIPEINPEIAPVDPMEAAINASFDTLEGYSGGAEEIHVGMKDGIITVEFSWNGEKYHFEYNADGTPIEQ